MLDLKLDVWETIAYAVIFGFSQDGESTFTGSLAYLSRKMMCSRGKTISALKRLVDLGLVQKIDITRNGVKFCEYRAYIPETGGTSEAPGSTSQVPVGSTPDAPNNISYENKDKIQKGIYNSAHAKFTPPTLEEVTAYCRERQNGIDPQTFIDHYTSNGWRVGNAPMKDWQAAVRTWEQRRKNEAPNPRPFPRPQPRQESVFEHNARIAENIRKSLMGGTPYDEQ